MEDASNNKLVEIGDDTNDSGDETQETAGVESASTKQPKKKRKCNAPNFPSRYLTTPLVKLSFRAFLC